MEKSCLTHAIYRSHPRKLHRHSVVHKKIPPPSQKHPTRKINKLHAHHEKSYFNTILGNKFSVSLTVHQKFHLTPSFARNSTRRPYFARKFTQLEPRCRERNFLVRDSSRVNNSSLSLSLSFSAWKHSQRRFTWRQPQRIFGPRGRCLP